MRRTIGDFLAAMRKEKGLTQQQVADKLGISNRTLSSWEQGRAYPDILTLPALAEIYGVTCDEILRGERADDIRITEDLNGAEDDGEREGFFKDRLLKFGNKITALTGVALGGAALVAFDAAAGSFAPVWLIAVLAVLSVVCFAVSVTLLCVFNQSEQVAAGVNESETPSAEAARFLRSFKDKEIKFLLIAGAAYFAAGALHGILYYYVSYDVIINELVYTATCALGYTITLFSMICGGVTAISAVILRNRCILAYGSAEEKATYYKRAKLFLKCGSGCAVPVGIAIILCIVFNFVYFPGYTDGYSAPREEFIKTMHTYTVVENFEKLNGIPAGEYFLDVDKFLAADTQGEHNLDNGLTCHISPSSEGGYFCNIYLWISDYSSPGVAYSGNIPVEGSDELIFCLGDNIEYPEIIFYKYIDAGLFEAEIFYVSSEDYIAVEDGVYIWRRRAEYCYINLVAPYCAIAAGISVAVAVGVYLGLRRKIK